jgi:hypothetical protein
MHGMCLYSVYKKINEMLFMTCHVLVSGTDFPSPPTQFRAITPRRAPQSRYRHLDTNDALLVPPTDTYLSVNQVSDANDEN